MQQDLGVPVNGTTHLVLPGLRTPVGSPTLLEILKAMTVT